MISHFLLERPESRPVGSHFERKTSGSSPQKEARVYCCRNRYCTRFQEQGSVCLAFVCFIIIFCGNLLFVQKKTIVASAYLTSTKKTKKKKDFRVEAVQTTVTDLSQVIL